MAVSRKPSCPKGMIIRESYRSKSGKRVSARCVSKTGLLKGKSSVRTSKLLAKSAMRSASARRMSLKRGMSVRSRCGKGQILRSGYSRKRYTRKSGKTVKSSLVAPSCITNRGKSGKSSRVIVLDPEDHFLSEYGYKDIDTMSRTQRHSALHKLIEHFTPIKGKMATYNYVIRALNARYILNRNTNPKVAKIMKADQRAISKIYKKNAKKCIKNA
jgi:hypothetical protein